MLAQPILCGALTPENLAPILCAQQGIHLMGAVDPWLVEQATASFRSLFRDQGKLRHFPFNDTTRWGYTPAGVERLQRRGRVNWDRHMFDYHPDMSLNIPTIDDLYRRVRNVGLEVLQQIDEWFDSEASASTSLRSNHLLRAAEYLRNESTSEDILFDDHIDFGLLTVFVGNGSRGLQVLVGGEWHDVILPHGDVFVGIGTALELYCKELKVLRHRVMGGDGNRLSPFLFIETDNATVLPSGETGDERTRRIMKDVRAA